MAAIGFPSGTAVAPFDDSEGENVAIAAWPGLQHG